MGELDETYGAVLVGAFVSAVLYGVTNAQVFVYFRENTNDKLIYKLAVSWLWYELLDTLHVALGIHMVYFYLITNFSDRSQLAIIVWSFKVRSHRLEK
ncbi:hypothetical protein WOLCODRAFT_77569 [Wolfiporia cocos MD-104 SS10]|uniref:Uncharacterized protein n=1 Tax=Wolfiporia cocos (strain MD-104) TaxID=742152 RepID=A0A2H3K478_WOLCO|nr:hypothetical protein WOLCODRAFT_77569 [Wolfiporia cocos MD-104 SS10]